MDKFNSVLKLFASSLFLLSPTLVNGIALPETHNPQCGYGYGACPQGYDCVTNSAYAYGPSSVCQPYSSTPLYTPPSSTPVYSSSTPVYSSSTPVYSSSTPVYSSSTPVYSSSTPVYSSSTPFYSSSTPVYSSSTPFYSSSTPVYSSSTPVYSSSTPVYSHTTSVYSSSTPIYSSSTPVYSHTTSVYSSSTPVYSSTTSVCSPKTVYISTTTVYGSSSPGYSSTTSRYTDQYGKDYSTPIYSPSTPIYSPTTPVYSPPTYTDKYGKDYSTPVYSPTTPVYSPTTPVYHSSSSCTDIYDSHCTTPIYTPPAHCTDKYGKDCTTAIYTPTTPIYTPPACTSGYGVYCSTSPSSHSGGPYSNNTYHGGSGNGGGLGGGGDGNGQNSTFTPVVGCRKVALRREINDLQKNHPDVFNMLLLALESLQNVDESKDLSYYQLSGIHGYPWTPWQYPASSVVNPGLGYCEHSSPIFTTWHRPYLVLLEQVLYKEAKSIADQFSGSDKAKYQAAAEEVRIPYWDWASPDTQSHIPASVQETTITVVKPGSGSTTIPNPLSNYRFLKPQDPNSGLGATTIRGSDDSILVSSSPSRQQQTLDLFTDTTYQQFSSDLEGIHNVIHVDVGGNMVFVSQAAFDPIFWLHHCNVDRLMAMYQASHPGLVVTPGPRSPTQALGGPGPDDISTPLYPFRHPDAKEWTSNDVSTAESIFAYGYAYPEVQPSSGSSASLQTQATQKVNELYGPDINSHSFQGVDSGAPQTPTARLEWSANVQCDMSELSGPHQILIYIGPYDKSSPDNYADVSKLAGTAAIFSGSQMPISSPNKLLNISVPLTESLIQESTPLHPQAVVPKLADQLHWVVQKVGEGSYDTIPTTDLPSLKIALISHLASYSPDKSQLPQKSDAQTHPDATAGKEGGLQAGQAPPVGYTAPQVLNGTLPTNSTGGSDVAAPSARK